VIVVILSVVVSLQSSIDDVSLKKNILKVREKNNNMETKKSVQLFSNVKRRGTSLLHMFRLT